MKKQLLTPEQIDASDFSQETKRKYLYRWNVAQRGKSIIEKRRELHQKLRDNAHLSLEELSSLLDISKRSVILIACRQKIKLTNVKRGPKPIPKEPKVKIEKVKAEKPVKAKVEKPVKVSEPKIKPVKSKKVKDRVVVGKIKKVRQRAEKRPKPEEKVYDTVSRDYTSQKMVPLGDGRSYFYVPFDASNEYIREERNRRLSKIKAA